MMSQRAMKRNAQEADEWLKQANESMDLSLSTALSPGSRTEMLRARRENNVNQLISRWDKDTHATIAPLAWHTAGKNNAPLSMQRSLGATFWNIKEGYEAEPAIRSNKTLHESRRWYKKREPVSGLNLGCLANLPPLHLQSPVEDQFKPHDSSWGNGGPLDPYQRFYRKHGGRDGYSNKDPELDGLASGAKITLGANLDALQTCLSERITRRERDRVSHLHPLPYFPEIHKTIEDTRHIYGDPTNGRPYDTNHLTDMGMNKLLQTEAATPLYSAFTIDQTFRPKHTTSRQVSFNLAASARSQRRRASLGAQNTEPISPKEPRKGLDKVVSGPVRGFAKTYVLRQDAPHVTPQDDPPGAAPGQDQEVGQVSAQLSAPLSPQRRASRTGAL